jgi:hypothetical protein
VTGTASVVVVAVVVVGGAGVMSRRGSGSGEVGECSLDVSAVGICALGSEVLPLNSWLGLF